MATCELVGDRIQVHTMWNERELIKQVPGARWDTQSKTWYLPISWSSCIVLRGVFRDQLTIGPVLAEWAWREKAMVDALLKMRTMLTPDPSDKFVRDVTDERLYPFQVMGATFLGCAEEVLLGDEMGTGKTIQVLAALETYADPYPVLVVCPNSVELPRRDGHRGRQPSSSRRVLQSPRPALPTSHQGCRTGAATAEGEDHALGGDVSRPAQGI
jgi:hypothetical protein